MSSHSVCRISESEIIEIIKNARKRILFMGPGVSKNTANAIVEQWKALGKDNVEVILDVEPEIYRLGYGEIDGLMMLQVYASSAGKLVCHQPGIRICLLIADDKTVVFSPTPLLVEAGSRNADNPNGIILDFLPENIASELGLGKKGLEEQTIGLVNVPANRVLQVSEDLKINPPQKFDIARKIQVFNSFFEFVELEIRNCCISRKTVPIPNDLFGFKKDEEAQKLIHSTFRLIGADSKITDKGINQLKNDILKKYLIPIKNYGNVILRKNKDEFEKEIESLKKAIGIFQGKVEEHIYNEIKKNKDSLVNALLPGVKANRPDRWTKSIGSNPSDRDIKRMLEKDITEAFEEAIKIVKDMKVSVIYKGVTFQTLNETEFRDAIVKACGMDIADIYEENLAVKAKE